MTIETFDQLQKRIPERIVEHAVRGMLPKGRVSSTMYILRRLLYINNIFAYIVESTLINSFVYAAWPDSIHTAEGL